MVTVNGLVLDTTFEQVLEDLKDSLRDSGTILFPQVKPLANTIQFSCPFHGNGQERHPSCGMFKVDQDRGDRVIPAGTVHCFTCGYYGSLTEFISNTFGYMDGGRFGNNWLKQHYTASIQVYRPTIKLNLDRYGYNKNPAVKHKYVPEDVLDSYRYIHPYMYQRGLTDEIIEEYDIGYDESTNCITMPLRDMTGQTVFVNRRSVGSKFHNFAANDPKTQYVYGMYELAHAGAQYDDPIYVTESILNALTWRKYGRYAVAFMGVGGGNQYNILKNSPYRHFVTSFDPDNAGTKATERFINRLRGYKTIERVVYPEYCYREKLDINDLQEKVLDLEITIIQ